MKHNLYIETLKNFPEKKMSRFFLKSSPNDEPIATALLVRRKGKTWGKRYPFSSRELFQGRLGIPKQVEELVLDERLFSTSNIRYS